MYSFYKLIYKFIFLNMLINNCPVCDSTLSIPSHTEASELVSCPDCHTRLVVANITNSIPAFQEAPKVEEDWGE